MAIYRKGNRWYTDLYDVNGERVRQVVLIEGVEPSKIIRHDALKVESIRKAEVAKGIQITSKKKLISLEELVRLYLSWAKENHKHPERDVIACKHLLSYFKNFKLDNISLFNVEGYKSSRKKLSKKPETINKELGVLRRMFNLAMEWKLIIENPIRDLKLLKVNNREYRVIRDWEFKALYEAASNHFKPILLTAYMTGMRKSEIRNLTWKNVDLDDEYIYVRNTRNFEDRAIPLNKILLNTLKILKEPAESEFVFTYNCNDHYASQSAWRRTWATTLRNAGIEKCRFHDLRHTFVSNLIVTHKEDFATVIALSGHKDISMLKRYSHTREEAKVNAINKLKFDEQKTLEVSRFINLNKSL